VGGGGGGGGGGGSSSGSGSGSGSSSFLSVASREISVNGTYNGRSDSRRTLYLSLHTSQLPNMGILPRTLYM